MHLVLIGPPGSGKGTISSLIKDHWHIAHISTGDLLRAELKKASPLADELREIMGAGQLVSDEIVTKLLSERIVQEDCRNGFLLDGYPRNLAQADLLAGLLEENDLKLDRALYVTVPTETIVERLGDRRVCKDCGATYSISKLPPAVEGVCDKCQGEVIQRVDDQPDTIRDRMEVYASATEPVLKYYRDQNLLVEYDNSGDLSEAIQKLEAIL